MGVIQAIRTLFRSPPPAGLLGSNRSTRTVTIPPSDQAVGLIAGSGLLPIRFCESARKSNCPVHVVCFEGETDPAIEAVAASVRWLKLGQLQALCDYLSQSGVKKAAMVGGINRRKTFSGVQLDLRASALLLRVRSGKDDQIMRAIAQELEAEGIEVIESTIFMQELFAREGVLTARHPSAEEWSDIEVGVRALRAMSAEDIGQLVVVRDGVVVAVEAVEGSDAAIQRGGELGGAGSVVVKFAKPTQDMRFDVPTIGERTIESLKQVGATVLAVEAGRSIFVEETKVIEAANRANISVVGCTPLVQKS